MKKKIGTIIVFALLFVGFIISLPVLLSTKPAKKFLIVPFIEQASGGGVHIGHVHLSWFGPQRFGNVQWKGQDSSEIAFDSLVYHAPLYKALFSNNWVDKVETTGLKAEFIDYPLGKLEFSDLPFPEALADLIGQKITVSAAQNEHDIQLNMTFDNGDAEIFIRQTKEGPRFSKEGMLRYAMPKEVANRLLKEGMPALASPLKIIFVKGGGYEFHINPVRVQLSQNTWLNKVSGNVVYDNARQNLIFDLKGIYSDKGSDSDVASQGMISLKNPDNYDITFQGERLKGDLICHLLPCESDEIKTLAGSFLGPQIQSSLTLVSKNRKLSGFFQLSSEKVKIPKAHFVLDGSRFALADPLNIQIEYLPQTMTLQLAEFSIKYSDKIVPDDVKLKGMLSIKDIELNHVPLVSRCHFTNGIMAFEGTSLSRLTVSLIGRMNQFDEKSPFSRALDNDFRFEINTDLAFSSDFVPFVRHFKIAGQDGEKLLLNLAGSSDSGVPNILIMSGNVDYLLAPELFPNILDAKEKSVQLLSPAKFQCLLEKVKFNIFNFSFLSSQGKLLIDEIAIGGGSTDSMASLKDIELPWEADSENDELAISLAAKTDPKGKVEAWAKIHRLSEGAEKWHVRAEAALDKFPVAMISGLSGYGDLDLLIGKNLDASIKVQDDDKDSKSHVSFLIEGDQLALSGALQANNSLTLEDPLKPAVFNYKLTPDRFIALRKGLLKQNSRLIDELQLHQSTLVTLEISDLLIPLSNPSHASLALQMTAGGIYVQDQTTEDLVLLKEMDIKAVTHDLAESIAVNFETHGHIYNQQNDNMNLSFHSLVRDLFDKNGSFNRRGASIDIQAKAHQAPAGFLMNFLCLDESLVNQADAFLGSRLNADMNVNLTEMTGPLQLELEGNFGRLSLDGYLSEGILTLRSPLRAEFSLSPSMKNSILDEVLPFLNSAFRSDAAITITVDPRGFSYPLWSKNPYEFSIGALKVDLGKMYFKNDQQIAQVLSILNYTTEQDLVSIWFTPLYLSYHNGIAEINRLDMLVADQFPIAIWGKVNFNEDFLNMKIGLGGQTLRKAFGLKGVPYDYYLQLSMKGSLGDPSINSNKASTKIAAFISQLRGGPQGALVGGIMDLLGGKLGQKATPPPTTHPFPWETFR